MVRVAQLVRASDCGSEGRGFEPHRSPQIKIKHPQRVLYFYLEDRGSNPEGLAKQKRQSIGVFVCKSNVTSW